MNTTSSLTTDMLLGDLAAAHPETVPVFLAHELDFCCGGRQSIAEACSSAGLDPNDLIVELTDTRHRVEHARESWLDRPLAELIHHIVTVFHEPLREKLPHLIELTRRVEAAHAADHGPVLSELHRTVTTLAADLVAHLDDEEQRLFPAIRRGDVVNLGETVDSLVNDHVAVASVLTDIRRMTNEFSLPEHACNTWRACWWNLAELERELKRHIHLENNVLFPRSLPV